MRILRGGRKSIEEKPENYLEVEGKFMIDVIVPIYNAYDDLVKCIDSIKRWTDLSRNRLILIDDCSPDERIRPYLESLEGENVIVIFNEKNQGFSNNINLGMEQSQDNDVLLLNSDTVVTKRWLEKIEECAYSDETIATVTPLSNNATLCSVPNFCEENVIPEGYTVESYGELIEEISLNMRPKIPVAHGFCMFIKREVIRKIGMFDAKAFGRGYGEENDFCHRAEQVGYYHVMCDNTFIFHSGTSSFLSEEKKKYIEEHDKILKERYPEQIQKVAEHCRDNPNVAIFENVRVFSGLRANTRKNILYLVQSDFREGASDNVGGTQLHVKDLTMGLRNTHNVFVAARDYNYLNVTGYIENKEYFFKFYIGETPEFPVFYDKKQAKLYGEILDAFRIDIVHIHHTYGLTLDLYKQAYERKLPLFVTLHDYYTICPTIKMLDMNNELCIGADHTERCQECLHKQNHIAKTVDYIRIWREEYSKVLKLADKVIVPSESAKEIVLSYYDFLSEKICVIEHGSEPMRKIKRSEDHDKKFHVAFLGGISPAKGSEYAFQMIKNSGADIEWYLFGMFGHNELSMMNKKNFHKIGGYRREDLPDLMEKYQIDLICILPIWPETFCYTISEAVLCGIPVLVTDIGAVGDRVREMGCGWLVPHSSPYPTILNEVYNIKNNISEYQRARDRVYQITLKTTENMINEYSAVYECESKRAEYVKCKCEFVLNGYLWANDLGGSSGGDADINKRLNEAEKRIQAITGSITFKTVQALAGIHIPFRKQIKALLFKGYSMVKK